MIKKSKRIFRDFFEYFTGTRKTHNEKRQNSDPEVEEYVRGKRKPKNIPDGYTDTKWLKKLNDKSWKSRCKKRKQYIKHDKSFKEEEILNESKKMLQKLRYKYRDKQWHEILIDTYGLPTTHEIRKELIWLKRFIKAGIFKAEYKTLSWEFEYFDKRIIKIKKVIAKVRLK